MLNKFKEFAAEQKDDGFVAYEWSDRIVKRGSQTFAIFGCYAYDVTKLKFAISGEPKGTGKLCVPVNGRYLVQEPDEGSSGIMGCYIINRKGENIFVGPSFVPCGWLYTDELQLTNDEIQENLIEDVLNGKNVFTKKPAGWL